jgi:hypothetical protein
MRIVAFYSMLFASRRTTEALPHAEDVVRSLAESGTTIYLTIPRGIEGRGMSLKMALPGDRREIEFRRTGVVEWPFHRAFSGENVRLRCARTRLLRSRHYLVENNCGSMMNNS